MPPESKPWAGAPGGRRARPGGSSDRARVAGHRGAQALLYDALVAEEVLALAPAHCLKIQTGQRAGRTSMAQSTINRLMLRLARRGLKVVRLKGGDPSIFGRVGEEREFLTSHGVEVEVVPGVTAACAAAAQFRFPLTHRGEARRLLISTRDGDQWRDAGGRLAAQPPPIGRRRWRSTWAATRPARWLSV